MLTLHFAPNSRAGRIVWLLEELELPYEINKMAFHPKDLKSDAHRARHPLGRVPVLDDGDVRIFESGRLSNTSLHVTRMAGCDHQMMRRSFQNFYSGSTTARVWLCRR